MVSCLGLLRGQSHTDGYVQTQDNQWCLCFTSLSPFFCVNSSDSKHRGDAELECFLTTHLLCVLMESLKQPLHKDSHFQSSCWKRSVCWASPSFPHCSSSCICISRSRDHCFLSSLFWHWHLGLVGSVGLVFSLVCQVSWCFSVLPSTKVPAVGVLPLEVLPLASVFWCLLRSPSFVVEVVHQVALYCCHCYQVAQFLTTFKNNLTPILFNLYYSICLAFLSFNVIKCGSLSHVFIDLNKNILSWNILCPRFVSWFIEPFVYK